MTPHRARTPSLPAHRLRTPLTLALALLPALAHTTPPPCLDALRRGQDIPCQIVLDQNTRAPYRGVLLSPAKSKLIQADLATLETALTEQKTLTAQARQDRDTARLEARETITDLLQTGQRLERANADLIAAQARLDASNRALADAIEAMPTRTTLALTAGLLVALSLAGGYALGAALE